VFYFLQFVYLFSTTKRKVYISCFISLPKPLTLLCSWQDFTSGCVLKISAIICCIDPFVDPSDTWTQGKSFNNILLRTTRNNYTKTTLVRNRHKESKRAWLRQKSKKGNPCTYSSGEAGRLCGWDCQNKSSKKCLTICSNIQTGSWRFPLPLTVSGVILKHNKASVPVAQW